MPDTMSTMEPPKGGPHSAPTDSTDSTDPTDTAAATAGTGALDPTHAGSIWSPRLRGLTVGMLLTITLAAFEALAVATAMPVVGHDLGMVQLYGWVFSAFMLANLVGIVLAGLLIDRRGVVPPYVLGVALFAAGLAVGGLAPSMPILIVGRAIQGIGAGAIPTTAYVVVQREYPRALRPVMFAYFATAWVLPGLVGPAIAGVVAEQLSWRLVFLALLPLAGLAALLTVPPLHALEHVPVEPDEELDGEAAELERPGAVRRIFLSIRVAVGAALILAALDVLQPVPTLALVIAGGVLAVPALVGLLPAGTLRARRGMPATVLLRGVLTFGFSGTEAFVPLMLVSVRGASASAAGLTLTAATITWATGSWLQARWFDRIGPRRLIGAGFAIVAVGIVSVVPVLRSDVPMLFAVVSWGITGLGMGICFAPITMTVMNLARPSEQGAATAAVSVSDVVGTALGTGVAGAVVAFGANASANPATTLGIVFGTMVAVILFGLTLTGRVREAAPA